MDQRSLSMLQSSGGINCQRRDIRHWYLHHQALPVTLLQILWKWCAMLNDAQVQSLVKSTCNTSLSLDLYFKASLSPVLRWSWNNDVKTYCEMLLSGLLRGCRLVFVLSPAHLYLLKSIKLRFYRQCDQSNTNLGSHFII